MQDLKLVGFKLRNEKDFERDGMGRSEQEIKLQR